MKPSYHPVGMLHVHHPVVMIILLQLGFKDVIHQVKRKHRLQEFVLIAHIRLTDIRLRGIEQHTVFEFRRTNHCPTECYQKNALFAPQKVKLT